jgi:molybdate transport system ATP-binding protein
LRVEWPGFTLDVDEHLPPRGVTALFGHSGSGKTTLLRCIAGLERKATGQVCFNGEVWQDERTWVPTHRRPIGYVFQEASLFPHLTVLGNLRYGQRRTLAKAGSQNLGEEQARARTARTNSAWSTPSSCSASATCWTAARRRSPAASASASAWPGHWP